MAPLIEPEQNGGYVNPVPEKRQFRDPYGDWWDKQERRNYGEPVCPLITPGYHNETIVHIWRLSG